MGEKNKELEILIVEDSKFQEALATECLRKKIAEGYKIKMDYAGSFEEVRGESVIWEKIKGKKYDGVLGGPFTLWSAQRARDCSYLVDLELSPQKVIWAVPRYQSLVCCQKDQKNWKEAVDLLIDKIKA